MAPVRNAILRQYGALPFAMTELGMRVLLVTTRGRRGWIIPKGWPKRKLSAAATAEREAYEEAGVIGDIVGEEPIGSYRYEKRGRTRRPTVFEVSVFLFAVKEQLHEWPEKSERETQWFQPEEASKLVAPAGLASIMLAATRRSAVGFGRVLLRTDDRQHPAGWPNATAAGQDAC